jgi:hypothetical protein
MQHARRHLLARPRRTRHQHAGPRRRHPLHRRADRLQGRALADQLRLRTRAQPQLGILGGQPRRLQRPAHDQQQPVGLEWLFDEVIGAELNGIHRRLDRAMARDHHHRHMRLLAMQRLQDPQTIQPRVPQPDVEHYEARPPRMERADRIIRIRRLAREIALVAQHAVDQHADIGFVVDDEDITVPS